MPGARAISTPTTGAASVQFDVVLTNPPFQNRTARGRTPHKLWIEFTRAALEQFLKPGGLLLQISPASFQSPSSKVLRLMCRLDTELIDFDVAQYFPGVNSSFAYYAIRNRPRRKDTMIAKDGRRFRTNLYESVAWLPTDLGEEALSIHRKVMWGPAEHLEVQHDYVTCHNIRLGETLSKSRTTEFCHPVFHTNTQTWYSSVQQDFARLPKIMWTRSGYTKPFFDSGILGATDMAYFVVVDTAEHGRNLAHNLNLPLFRYIFRTAKWSGFGNELVFEGLPALPLDRTLTHGELCELFGLTEGEVEYVEQSMG